MIVTLFTISNVVLLPFAYVKNTFILLFSIFTSNSCNGYMKQTWLALQFIVGGLILLLISIVWDTLVFSYNLFTEIGKDELGLEASGRITADGIKIF